MTKDQDINIFFIHYPLLVHPLKEKGYGRSGFKIIKFYLSLSSFFDFLWRVVFRKV